MECTADRFVRAAIAVSSLAESGLAHPTDVDDSVGLSELAVSWRYSRVWLQCSHSGVGAHQVTWFNTLGDALTAMVLSPAWPTAVRA